MNRSALLTVLLVMFTACSCASASNAKKSAKESHDCGGRAGVWLHVDAANAPTALSELPIRRPFVLAQPDGLVVLSPESSGRYDLCARKWTAIDRLDTPHGEYGFPPAVRGGDDLFFIGEDSGDGAYGYFTRLNLRDLKWHPLPKDGAPKKRVNPLTAFGAGQLLVFGGRTSIGWQGETLNDGALFDAKSGRWTPLPATPPAANTDAVVAVTSSFFFWPQMQLYSPSAGTWKAARNESRAEPYQATIVGDGDRVIALGGLTGSHEEGEYDAVTDHWTIGPAERAEGEAYHLGAVVKGVPVMVSLPAWQEEIRERTADGVIVHAWMHCNGWRYQLARVNPSTHAWDHSERNLGDDCMGTLMITPDAVFLFELFQPGQDRVVHAWDPSTNTWRRATLPAAGAPPSEGHLRWDGRAFWQWGAWTYTQIDHPCGGTPEPGAPICDPFVETRSAPVYQAWRIEPVWTPEPATSVPPAATP